MGLRTFGMVATMAMVVTVAPEPAVAQESPWWAWALREFVETREAPEPVLTRREGDRKESSRRTTIGDIILGRDTDRDRDRDRSRGNGPPFCRNGEGHPVHGRQWCRDKGFGVGSRSGVSWERRGWEDIILPAPRDRDRRSGAVDRGGLIDILGDVIYGRLAAENRRAGGSEPLTGRWLRPEGSAEVLQIRSGRVPVAELNDVDGDGRVDVVLVPRR